MLAYLSQFVLSVEGVITACASIVIFALWATISFSVRITPIIRTMKKANSKISEYDGELTFAENYEDFNTWVADVPLLKSPWQEFTETLILESGEKIKNTDDAETFFNEATIISPSVNLRFYSSLSNIITGTGILGTFIGLVFGVYEAAEKITVTSTNYVPPEEAMKGLLTGASLAFMTSISGLGMSIIFSWYEKHFSNRANNLVRQWNLSLDERLERLTPERIAVDTYREVQQQTQELKSFNNELIFSIQQSLEENIIGGLQPVLQDLLAVTREMRDHRELANEEMLKGIVDEFKQAIQGAAGKEISSMAETLEKLNESLSQQTNGMVDSHQKMNEETQKLIEKVGQVLNESVVGLEKTLNNIDKAAEKMGDTAHIFVSVIDKINGSFEQLETISRRLENVSIALEETAGGLTDLNSSQAEAVGSIKEGIEVLRSSQDQVVSSWEAYSNRFGDIDNSLSKFFTDLQQGVQGYSEQVNTFLKDIDGLMAESVDKLGGAASEIRETVDGLSEQLDAILEAFRNMAQKSSVQALEVN